MGTLSMTRMPKSSQEELLSGIALAKWVSAGTPLSEVDRDLVC